MERNKKGVIMIESTYCITAVIVVLIGLMGFGFIIYQAAMFKIASDQVAEDVVHTYKLRNVGETKDITEDDVTSVGLFRYFGNSLESNSENHLKTMAADRIALTSFAQDDGEMTTEIEPFLDDIGRRHYKVTVTKPYKFLFGTLFDGSIFPSFKIDNKMTATVYVEGVDALNYFNCVSITNYAFRKAEESIGIFETISNCLGLANRVINFFTGGF